MIVIESMWNLVNEFSRSGVRKVEGDIVRRDVAFPEQLASMTNLTEAIRHLGQNVDKKKKQVRAALPAQLEKFELTLFSEKLVEFVDHVIDIQLLQPTKNLIARLNGTTHGQTNTRQQHLSLATSNQNLYT